MPDYFTVMSCPPILQRGMIFRVWFQFFENPMAHDYTECETNKVAVTVWEYFSPKKHSIGSAGTSLW